MVVDPQGREFSSGVFEINCPGSTGLRTGSDTSTTGIEAPSVWMVCVIVVVIDRYATARSTTRARGATSATRLYNTCVATREDLGVN